MVELSKRYWYKSDYGNVEVFAVHEEPGEGVKVMLIYDETPLGEAGDKSWVDPERLSEK